MAEPTLGARILDAANAYAAAISEQVVALDRGAWEVAHADAVTEAMDRLRALCARADAAERGMVAVSRREALADAWYVADELGVAAAKAALDVADTEYDNALADWRALVGVGA